MLAKTSIVLGIILLAAVMAENPPKKFDTDEEGLHQILNTSKFTFVIFHGHDCPYCDFLRTVMDQLYEEYQEQYPDLQYALVNAEAFHDVRKKHSIENYPVAKLFSGPTYFNFFIQRLSKEQIHLFIEDTLSKKSKAVEISSDRAYVKYNNLDYALVFSTPEITDTEKSFAQNIQNLFPHIPVFYTTTGSKWDKLLFKDKDENKKFRMYFKRDFDEGDKTFARKKMFDAEDLAATLRRVKDPRISTINKRLSDEVFSGLHPALVVFDKDINSSRITTLTKVLLANSFAGIPLKTNGTDAHAEAFLNHLGVQESDMPVLRIIGVGGGKINKFKYEGDWSEKDLIVFLRKFKESKLDTYLKNAAKTPGTSSSKIQSWNRDQYYENLEDSENVLVVGFVAKWCARCQQLSSLFEKTRANLRDKKSFIFAIVDLDQNDIDGVDISKSSLVQIIQNKNIREYTGEHDPEALSEELNSISTDEL